MNARGFEQNSSEHYNPKDLSSPVTNYITIWVVFIIMLMAGMIGKILDVKGSFLRGKFKNGEKVHMKVPEGFKKYYPPNTLLLLLAKLYGIKQAAMVFWKVLLVAMCEFKFERSGADPCLYFKWNEE